MKNDLITSADFDDGKKDTYKYRVINKQGKKFYGYIDALDEESVKSYLKNEGLKIIEIEKQGKFKEIKVKKPKLKDSEISFMLTQLSTYLKAGIPLIDAVKILEKQSVKSKEKRIYSNIIFELSKGENLSNALRAQNGVFPIFLVNMIKTAELTGDLNEVLEDMQKYYDKKDKNKKAFINSMTYPLVLFSFAILVLIFILTYVLPQFVTLFEKEDATIPTFTKVILGVSSFLSNHLWGIIFFIILLVLLICVLYKYVRSVRKGLQIFIMKLPFIGKIIIYNEIVMFTKTFSSLLSHKVFITDSIKVLEGVSNNEVFKDIIKDSLNSLSKGENISSSFENKWVFPVAAYEMLVTGENTGKLDMMMKYVGEYYEDLEAGLLKRFNSFIEPILIVFIAVIVGIVVISVIIPMFSFYGSAL